MQHRSELYERRCIWEVFYSRFAPLESSLGLSLGSVMINLGVPRFASLFAPEVMKSDFYLPDERKAIRALTVSTKNLNAALGMSPAFCFKSRHLVR